MQISQIRAILAELFDTATEPGTSDAIIEHTADTNEGITGSSIDASYDLLYAYIDAELDGEDVSQKFPELYEKIQAPGIVQDEYDALSKLLFAERNEQLEEPPFPALFDFSYLPEKNDVAPARGWQVAELGKILVHFSEELLAAFQPPMQLAGVKSGDDEGGELRFRYVLQREVNNVDNDVDIEILARTSRLDPGSCNISVSIDVRSRNGWPNLSGSEVLMRRSDDSIDTQTTDAFGKVLFRNISERELPQLTFEITPIDSVA